MKTIATLLSLIPLILLLSFNWVGISVNYDWFPTLSVRFHLAVDHLSLVFLFLTAIIFPLAIIAFKNYPPSFYVLALLLEVFLIIFFTARDLIVFTIFWEAMLLPLYFIINLWGGEHRRKVSLKFLIYMLAGSSLLILAVLSLYFGSNGTFDFSSISIKAQTIPYATWVFAIFMLAFAVKTPLFPFHAWLPDTYAEAPFIGTVFLSAILSKAGIYGFLRIGKEFYPTFLNEWSPLLIGLAIAGVLYGGMAAWMQTDYKRLLAYSSFSHVNFILVGVFLTNQWAYSGALLQSINHAITISALFLVIFWLEERIQTTKIGIATGLAKVIPQLCWLTLFFILSSVALPGTNNFIGELLIFFAVFVKYPFLNALFLTALLGLTIILSVIYMLYWFQKTYYEHTTDFHGKDIQLKEWAVAAPLIALILWMGIYPTPFIKHLLGIIE